MFNSATSGFNTGRSIGDSLYKSGSVSSSKAKSYGGAIGAAIGLVADVYSMNMANKQAKKEYQLVQQRNNIVFREMASALADNARQLAVLQQQTAGALYDIQGQKKSVQSTTAAQLAAVGMAGASYQQVQQEYSQQAEAASARTMQNYLTEAADNRDQGRAIINNAINQTQGASTTAVQIPSLDMGGMFTALSTGVEDFKSSTKAATPATQSTNLGSGLGSMGNTQYGIAAAGSNVGTGIRFSTRLGI